MNAVQSIVFSLDRPISSYDMTSEVPCHGHDRALPKFLQKPAGICLKFSFKSIPWLHPQEIDFLTGVVVSEMELPGLCFHVTIPRYPV